MVVVVPEQYNSKHFEAVLDDRAFRQLLVWHTIDEAHLVDTWGGSFCKAYLNIGPLHLKLSSSIVLLDWLQPSSQGGLKSSRLIHLDSIVKATLINPLCYFKCQSIDLPLRCHHSCWNMDSEGLHFLISISYFLSSTAHHLTPRSSIEL